MLPNINYTPPALASFTLYTLLHFNIFIALFLIKMYKTTLLHLIV